MKVKGKYMIVNKLIYNKYKEISGKQIEILYTDSPDEHQRQNRKENDENGWRNRKTAN